MTHSHTAMGGLNKRQPSRQSMQLMHSLLAIIMMGMQPRGYWHRSWLAECEGASAEGMPYACRVCQR
jgi:hypothetical protein